MRPFAAYPTPKYVLTDKIDHLGAAHTIGGLYDGHMCLVMVATDEELRHSDGTIQAIFSSSQGIVPCSTHRMEDEYVGNEWLRRVLQPTGNLSSSVKTISPETVTTQKLKSVQLAMCGALAIVNVQICRGSEVERVSASIAQPISCRPIRWHSRVVCKN